MISCDTETTSLDLKHNARPFFVTMCSDESPDEPTYWEWPVDPETRMPVIPEEDIREIRLELCFGHELVLHNSKFDSAALASIGCVMNWPWKLTHDTLFTSHLLASSQPKDLTSCALIYLGVNIKPYEEALKQAVVEARRYARSKLKTWKIAKEGLEGFPSIKGEDVWKNDMWLPRAVALHEGYPNNHPWWTVLRDYSLADSMVTLPLFKVHKELLEKRGLWEIYLERRKLLKIVYEMESRGITYDKNNMDELGEQYRETAATCNRVCVNLSGGKLTELPKGVNNELRDVVFNHLKMVPFKKTDSGNDGMDKYVIEEWLARYPENTKEHVFIRNMAAFRKRATALGYAETYQKYGKHLQGSYYGLYCSVNPVGTGTLRWSSQYPNSQQISKQEIEEFNEDEVEREGKKNHSARYMFCPMIGREWWSLDYQNIEKKIPAYVSNERVMIDLFEKPNDAPYFGSGHLLNASIIYPELFWPVADNKGAFKKKYNDTYYQWVKNFGFAVDYGAVPESGTADRAAHKVGAQKMVMGQLKEHSRLNQSKIDMANRLGYVETLPDREINPKRGYPLECSRSKWGKVSPTIPLNYFVQGSACWVVFRAMIKIQEYLNTLPNKDYRMILNVHDEVVLDFPKDKGEQPWLTNLPIILKVQKIMEHMGDCIGVPLTTSREYHETSWGEGRSV